MTETGYFKVLNFGHSCLPAGRGAYLGFGAWILVLLILLYALCPLPLYRSPMMTTQ